jgi:hypothetical protein
MIPSQRRPFEDDAEWRAIEQFPGYSVSSSGYVRNDRTGYNLSRLVNQRGILYVGITVGREQVNRSVPRLVAETFLEPPSLESFTTPIQLNGEKADCRVSNLMWRPLWFARKYIQQFRQEKVDTRNPIIDVQTEEYFASCFDAAIKFGLLDRDIVIAIFNRTEVWPTYQRFIWAEPTHTLSPRKHPL